MDEAGRKRFEESLDPVGKTNGTRRGGESGLCVAMDLSLLQSLEREKILQVLQRDRMLRTIEEERIR